MPNYIVSQAPGKIVLRNYEGVITTYSEPRDYTSKCNCEDCQKNGRNEGISALLSGQKIVIEPSSLERRERTSKH